MDSFRSYPSSLENSPLLIQPDKQKSELVHHASDSFSHQNSIMPRESTIGNGEDIIGVLEVFIHHARDIHNICIYHKQDVYAKLCLTNNPDITVSTKIVNGGGKNPIFNENLQLNVGQINASLKCEVWMLSRVRNYLEDQLLGFALVPLSQVIGNGCGTQEFSLSSTDLFHSPAGFVQLSISYSGYSPRVSAPSVCIAAPLSVNPDTTLPDTVPDSSISTEYSKMEFPDLNIANENQRMVSEYFGIPCNNLDSESSESLIKKNNCCCSSCCSLVAAQTGEMESESVEASTIRSACLSLPCHVVKDLLYLGVCARCIFRLFGVHGSVYSCSLLSTPFIWSVLEEARSCHNDTSENGPGYCNICLGILQLVSNGEQEMCISGKKDIQISDFAGSIAQLVKREGHQIDSFSLEVSVPPITLANERSIWLYMKKKYGFEDWFQEKVLAEHISLKDALKLSIINSLETLLGVKSGASSFRIRLTYTHTKASSMIQGVLSFKDHGCKKRKIGTDHSVESIDGSLTSGGTEATEHSNSESYAVIQKSLNALQDDAFSECFKSPPDKVNQPCHLTTVYYRTSIYIGGRYLKYSRNVSQTRWIIDDERMGDTSVEEVIGSNILHICHGDNYKFHAAGREDIDVRMLGSGRPFLIEIINAQFIPSCHEIEEMQRKINNSGNKSVRVKNLKEVGSEVWTLMREGEAEKQKQYAALVWISRPLKDEDLQCLSLIKDKEIFQKTPIRVLHRRSPLERKRIIHWMKGERIVGSCQYFLLHLCSQAGTYIKEFVHGDLGRTHPSLGQILGCRAEILHLDVTDVKMNFD